MALILALLTSRAGMIGAALLAAFIWHQHDKSAAIAAHDLTANNQRREEVAAYYAESEVLNDELSAQLLTAKQAVKTEIKTVIKEVQNYVSIPADSRCVVPAGFVRGHDAAWGVPGVPAAAGEPSDAPSGFPLSRVLITTADNAGAAREWRDEALGWRKWYSLNAAQYDQFCSKSKACQPTPKVASRP